ncbi:hypothetical protein [Parasphingorhabdus sp.]|uniref:class I SAM-dependent methyltransferase n=1 Tax=Parasphingorhabdus sp. TaxID=2709688 RepID=UPI003265E89F
MKNKLFLIGMAGAILTTPTMSAMAKHHEDGGAESHQRDLKSVLADDRRAGDNARDKYRKPIETLKFFQIKPSQTVAEYGPGGGWYTRILLPYVSGSGKYVAINGDSSIIKFSTRAREARFKSWPERFPETASGWTGVDADKISAFESDELPDEMKGKIDRIVIFRSLHGLLNGNRADAELRSMREMLADDGMIGVVQHRAKADASYAMSNGTKGYLKQSSVVALFELNGFELVGSSEINANPKDTANYEGGVWTLPPILRKGDEDKAKYQAIGESDRMTLLFRKRA